MLNEQFILLLPAVAALLLLAAFVLYVFYTTERHYRLKLLLGPALLAACACAVPAVGARLGYGWPAPLPEAFQYVGHRTVVVGGEKRWIDVMAISRKTSGAQARLHRVPWTRQMQETLEGAERMKQGREGGDIVVSRQAGSGGSRSNGDAGYSAARVLPRDVAPKEPLPGPSMPQPPQPEQAPAVPRVIA